MILQGTCSEAVFRFHTTKPKDIQEILQTIADEISANNNAWGQQKVPLFETAEEYDTGYMPKEPKKKIIKALEKDKVLLYGCAGLGDNDAVIKVNKKKGYFTLNIGNNDISPNATGWVEGILDLGIEVEEAETCKELQKIARDCTCGIVYGF